MRFEQLLYYVNVCNLGSINKASQSLHIAQQSLSTSIQNLENEVGAKLLERNNKGIIPTTVGKGFYNFALETLTNYQEFQETFFNKKSQLEGSVRVVTINAYNKKYLPNLQIYFLQHFPKVNIESYDLYYTDILQAINNNDADIALTLLMQQDYVTLENEFVNSEFVKLSDVQLYCLMSNKNPLAQSSSITLQQLQKENIIFLDEYNNYLFNKLIPNYHAKIPNRNNCNNIYMLKELVQSNITVCVDLKFSDGGFSLAQLFDPNKIVAVKIKNIPNSKKISWGYLVNKNFKTNPLFCAFEEFFNVYFSDN